jgi:hypothetical protein
MAQKNILTGTPGRCVGVAGGKSTSTGQQFTPVANPPRNSTVLTLEQANLALKIKNAQKPRR